MTFLTVKVLSIHLLVCSRHQQHLPCCPTASGGCLSGEGRESDRQTARRERGFDVLPGDCRAGLLKAEREWPTYVPLPGEGEEGRHDIDLNVGDLKGPYVPTLCFASHRQPGTFEVGLAQWGAGFRGDKMLRGRGPGARGRPKLY